MKNIKIVASTVFFLFVIIISCKDDFLERQPLNESSDIGFYRNASDALAALNSVYDVMQWNFLWKFEIGVIGTRYNNDVGVLPRADFSTGFLPTNERRLGAWAQLYVGINRANIVLDRVAQIDMDEALKARILAEAKFCRGLYYFTLARMWGDVPIRLESTSLETLTSPKSPREDVIAQAVKDLLEAEAVLPIRSTQAGGDLGRATKGSATALIGKLYLYDENWTQAAAKFAEVINSGEYQLNEEYLPQFLLGGDNSPESIFEVQFQSGGPGWNETSDGSWMSGWNGVTGHSDAITFGFGGGSQPNEEFVSSFEDGDARRGYIVTDGDDYFGIPFIAANSTTGYGSIKYIVPKTAEPTNSGDSPINHHIIRYADVLLMYAEALNNINGGPTVEAYDAINQVRNRANLANLPEGLSQQEFFESLVKERRVELYLEHQRTWDLIRWGLAEEVLGPTNEYQSKNKFMPIPQSELNANPELIQNPDYQ